MEDDHGDLQVIDVPEDCGNAPRKIVIRDFLIAVYQGNIDAVAAVLHDEVQWEIVGSTVLTGIEEVRDWLTRQPTVVKLEVAMVITHGTDCGADGTVEHPDGSKTRFNHIVVFAGHSKTAKIKQLRSYLIGS